MRYLWLLMLVISKMAVSGERDICGKIMPIADDNANISELYYFKEKNGLWHEQGNKRGVSYTLEPKEVTGYKFFWTVKEKSQGKITHGSLTCEIPSSWRLALSPPVEIVYPKVTHGHNEDLSLYSVKTVAGIYLAQSKYSLPDFVRLMWHLKQDAVSSNVIDEIIADHKFLSRKTTTIIEDRLDKTNQVQLIGLNISNQPELDRGNSQWLIANEEDHSGISDGSFKSDQSAHNALLPWYDPHRPEFESQTPFQAYESTIVGPIGILSVFDHKLGLILADPVATMDKIQMIYDAVASSALNYLKGSQLFVHLVLKQPRNYKLLTFEVLDNGTFSLQTMKSLSDPQEIGLPSAYALGFIDANGGM